MNAYWVSILIQNSEDKRAWSCSFTTPALSLDEANKQIENGRKNYRVLSAWIDTFNSNDERITVFHECYVDVFGNMI